MGREGVWDDLSGEVFSESPGPLERIGMGSRPRERFSAKKMSTAATQTETTAQGTQARDKNAVRYCFVGGGGTGVGAGSIVIAGRSTFDGAGSRCKLPT